MWATRTFDRNALVTEYDGRVISRKAALRLRDIGLDTHCISIDFSTVIDGLFKPTPGRGGGSFLNDPRDQRINSEFIRLTTPHGVKRLGGNTLTCIFVKAKRRISDGEEIFASYGTVYWEVHAQGRNKMN